VPTEKPLSTILSETKQEIGQFVTTRVGMLKAEIEEKIARGKKAGPAIGVAVAFLLAGWLVLNFALVGLLHVLFLPRDYAWGLAGLIVAIVDLVIGAVALRSAMRAINAINLTPNRTLTVLKQDQAWLQNEARTA
jgi:Putative Actinobacterial Holin-X, holin superfamily III